MVNYSTSCVNIVAPRHLKALAWMVSALICSGATRLGTVCMSKERPKHKVWTAMATVLDNQRVRVNRMYLP